MKSPLRIKYPNEVFNVNQQKLKTLSEDPVNDYNDYLQRLTKLIPGEAISVYLTAKNMAGSDCYSWLPLIGIIPLLVVRILGTKVEIPSSNNKLKTDIEWWNVIISLLSYIIWIYAIGDSFLNLTVDNLFIVGLVMMLWTFLIPYMYKPKS